ALFDRGKGCEDARSVALVPKTERVVDKPQIVEVIASVLLAICERAPAKHRDTGVMHPASDGHLRVPVDDRSTSAPQAVPDHEVVLRARILLVRGERPAAGCEKAIADDFRIHRREGVVLVE